MVRLAEWQAAIAHVREIYALVHGRKLNLFRPVRYTEKIQWRKLFDFNPIYPVVCDKFAVRDFIAARVGETYHVPLLWSGAAADIPFDELTPPYVIKSNHAWAQVIMIDRDEDIDRAAILETTEKWLAKPYGVEQNESGYVNVPRRMMVERMLTTASGGPPQEYRFFVFGGKLAVIQQTVIEDRNIRHGAFYLPDWTRLDWYFTRRLETLFSRPDRLDEMIRIAERLGEGLSHLRVDIYDDGRAMWLGELTLYPWSGHAPFNPDEADFLLGKYWRLPAPWLQAMAVILCRRRPKPANR